MIWLAIIAAGLVAGGIAVLGIRFSHKQSTTWKVIKEGQFSKLVVGEKLFSGRGGAAMYTSAQNLRKIGRIYFFDGNYVEAWGVTHVPAQRGDRIRVSENGFFECKVENLEEQR